MLMSMRVSTGNASAGGDVPLGFDYSVCAVLPRGSTSAQVSRLSGGTATAVGSVPVTFLSADQVRFTVPPSLLGNDDGRVAFKVVSMQWVDGLIRTQGPTDADIGLRRVSSKALDRPRRPGVFDGLLRLRVGEAVLLRQRAPSRATASSARRD